MRLRAHKAVSVSRREGGKVREGARVRLLREGAFLQDEAGPWSMPFIPSEPALSGRRARGKNQLNERGPPYPAPQPGSHARLVAQ